MTRPRQRGGVGLVETLVALGLFATLGFPVLAALQTGASGTARGGEHQLAALLAARIADAAARARYHGLGAMGQGGAVDLEALDAGGLLVLAEDRPFELDGVRFRARVAVSEPAPALRRARITVEWTPAGRVGHGTPQRLVVVRLVGASPLGEGVP